MSVLSRSSTFTVIVAGKFAVPLDATSVVELRSPSFTMDANAGTGIDFGLNDSVTINYLGITNCSTGITNASLSGGSVYNYLNITPTGSGLGITSRGAVPVSVNYSFISGGAIGISRAAQIAGSCISGTRGVYTTATYHQTRIDRSTISGCTTGIDADDGHVKILTPDNSYVTGCTTGIYAHDAGNVYGTPAGTLNMSGNGTNTTTETTTLGATGGF
jgi:hypothetical protein